MPNNRSAASWFGCLTAGLLVLAGSRLFDGKCAAQELFITPVRIAGEAGISVPPELNGVIPHDVLQPTHIWGFGAPTISPGGQILYTANLATNLTSDVLFDTRDSIWTTTMAEPNVAHLEVAYGTPAPRDGWLGSPLPGDAPKPLFGGTGSTGGRLNSWGITDNGTVLFTGPRFGFPQSDDGQGHGQGPEGYIWQVTGGVIDKYTNNAGDNVTIDFEFMSDAGDALYVVKQENFASQLYLNDTVVAEQTMIENRPSYEFDATFASQGAYQISHQGDIFFQTGISNGIDSTIGIFKANENSPLSKEIISLGGKYFLRDGEEEQLSDLTPFQGDGYQLQVTSTGEVGFIGDDRVLLAFHNEQVPSVHSVVGPGPLSARIDGRDRSIQLGTVEDLLIAPDDTIYFEAEAEIREVGSLGIYKNYVWKMEPADEKGSYLMPEAILAQGEIAVEVEGPNDILFGGDRISLKDANADGKLLLSVKLDKGHANVNNGNDDALVLLDNEAFPTIIAREGDVIPTLGGATFGPPIAARGSSMSTDGAVVFLSGGTFNANRSTLPAVLLAQLTDDDQVDFFWSGRCESTNWHDECGLSNWNDATGEPALDWPGDASGTESAFISAVDVVISDQAVDLKSLRASGSLEVNHPLRLRENSTAQNLNLKADLTTDQQLKLSGKDNQWQSGTINGDSELVKSDVSEVLVEQGGNLVIIGSDKILSTNVVVESGAVVDQQASLLTITGDANLTTANGAYTAHKGTIVSPNRIINRGTIRKRLAVSGETPGDFEIRAPISNEGGVIESDTGTFVITGDVTHVGGTYRAEEGATLRFQRGTHTIKGNSEVTASGNGSVELAGGSYTVESGSNATFRLPSTEGFLIDGVLIDAQGSVKNSGHATFRGGTIKGGSLQGENFVGGFENAKGSTMLVVAGEGDRTLAGVLQNNGTTEHEQQVTLHMNDGILLNHTDAQYHLARGADIKASGGTNRFDNAGGTVRIDTPFNPLQEADRTTVDVPFNISNGGQVTIVQGGLQLIDGGTHSGSGRVDLQTAGGPQSPFSRRLDLAGIHEFNGSFDISGSGFVKVDGDVKIAGGQTTLKVADPADAGARVTFSPPSTNLDVVNGKLVNEGNLDFVGVTITGGVLTQTGITNGLENRAGGILTFDTNDVQLTNAALRNVGGGGKTSQTVQAANVTLNNSTIVNESGGLYRLKGDIKAGGGANRLLVRGGIFSIESESPSKISVPIDLQAGEIRVTEGDTTFDAGGESKGSGIIELKQGKIVNYNLMLSGSQPFKFDGEYELKGKGNARFGPESLLDIKGTFTTNLTFGGVSFDGQRAGPLNPSDGRIVNKGNFRWKSGDLGAFQNRGRLVMDGFNLDSTRKLLSVLENMHGGTVEHAQGDVELMSSSVINNFGTYQMRADIEGDMESPGRVVNQTGAKFIVSTGEVAFSHYLTANLDNQGTLEVAEGAWVTVQGDIAQTTSQAGERILSGGTWILRPMSQFNQFDDFVAPVAKNLAEIIIYGDAQFGILPTSKSSGSHDFENANGFFLRENADFVSSADITNSGRLAIDATSSLTVRGQFSTTKGSINVIQGTLNATAENDSIQIDGGEFLGTGTINGHRFDNQGTLRPGASPGTLTLNVDEFVQGPEGRIIAEIAGVAAGKSYDQLVIGGTAMLGGTLEVQLLEDTTLELFRPENGTAFQFVSAAGGVEGAFDQVVFNTPGVNADLDVTYDDGSVMVTVLDTTLLGDFNGDDMWSVEDLDLLSSVVIAETNDPLFDLTGNALVDVNDVTEFLTFVHSLPGDANLDGTVTFQDFLIVSGNFGNAGVWSHGDFNNDGQVAFADFLALSGNFGQMATGISNSSLASVPEPNYLLLLALAFTTPWLRRRMEGRIPSGVSKGRNC